MDINLGKNVIIKVISVKGKCDYKHKKGQTFEHPFLGLCPYALHTLWPYVTAKRFGGKIPWEKNEKINKLIFSSLVKYKLRLYFINNKKLEISCPNPFDLVVFRLSTK